MFYRMFAIVACLALAALAIVSGPANATARTVRKPLRLVAYNYAVKQNGKRYCWGGAGPSCYDCSGLVYAAYRHAHISLGRTTYSMLRNRRLVRISQAKARSGDLAFYGTGHVELFDRSNITFGAHNSHSRIGWSRFNRYWHPTAYYRVRGAG